MVEDFRIKNTHRLRALALAVDMVMGRAAPRRAAVDAIARSVLADSWQVLAWASTLHGGHADMLAEGVATRTDALDLGGHAASLGGLVAVNPPGNGVWGAVRESVARGAFDDAPHPYLVLSPRAPEASRMAGPVVDYPTASGARLPRASVDGVLRLALHEAPEAVREARRRVRLAVERDLPEAARALRDEFAGVPLFAVTIDGCATARELVDAFPASRSLFEETQAPATPPAATAGARMLRALA